MAKENREHKDSVFIDLFYNDETAGENLLSLYNALHDTDLRDVSLIRKIRVDDVLYMNFKNDLSVVIGGEVLDFAEHQSTINPNIPLRLLMYLGRAYEQLVETEARYRTRLVKIPTPEFYVFYNGKQELPTEQVLRLSDAFLKPPGENSAELTVWVFNINAGKFHERLGKCKVLKEYSLFMDAIRRHENEENGMKMAIEECIENRILEDYLKRRGALATQISLRERQVRRQCSCRSITKGSKVRNMLIAEYDYDTDMRVKQEDARLDGWEQGIQKGFQSGLM